MRPDTITALRPSLDAPAVFQANGSHRTGWLLGSAIGLGVAALAAWALPQTSYRTTAIIEIGLMDPAVRLALAQSARQSVVASPVLSRAASVLIAAGESAPQPDVAERFALTAGLAGSHATNSDARLAATLVPMVQAGPGAILGTIDVTVDAVRADRAAKIATAVAEAFVADQDELGADARRKRDVAMTQRLERARTTADAARTRFAALGGTSVDPAQSQATAASATIAAQKRIDLIRTIMATSSPPLSERRDVPDQIATVQRTYLDLVAQLAKARETLGDKHMMIISLREGVARATTEVTAAWKRLERAAQADLQAAREREAMIRKAETPADSARRAELDEARSALQHADEEVATADAARVSVADAGHAYRLIARAPIPVVANGLSVVPRAALAALTGLLALLIARFGLPFGLPSRRPKAATAISEPTTIHAARRGPHVAPPIVKPDRVKPAPSFGFFEGGRPTKAPQAERRTRPVTAAPEIHTSPIALKPTEVPVPNLREKDQDEGLRHALTEMIARFEALDPQYGVPTLMVGANDRETATSPVSMAIARAAAAMGRRVLVVESDRPIVGLAAMADCAAEPILVDVFGTLRVALPAAGDDGMVQLAPAIEDGTRIAADLARHGDAALVDDLADGFDLVIVDGRDRSDAIPVDAYLRIGRFCSNRDDHRFLATCDASDDAFLGTLVGSVFFPHRSASAEDQLGRETDMLEIPQDRASSRHILRSPSQPKASPRRRVMAR